MDESTTPDDFPTHQACGCFGHPGETINDIAQYLQGSDAVDPAMIMLGMCSMCPKHLNVAAGVMLSIMQFAVTDKGRQWAEGDGSGA